MFWLEHVLFSYLWDRPSISRPSSFDLFNPAMHDWWLSTIKKENISLVNQPEDESGTREIASGSYDTLAVEK